MALVHPECEREFKNYGMKLPVGSGGVLAVSHLLQEHGSLVVILTLPLLVVDGILLFLFGRCTSVRWLAGYWFGVGTALLLLANVIVVLTVFLPYLKLWEGLGT